MNLAVDIGNTNIKIGVFDEEKLISSYRVASDISHTADEYGITIPVSYTHLTLPTILLV